jgi:predicted dehydrogenase
LNIHRVPSQPVLKAAVIGAGVFGRLHAAKYRALPEIELIAIADPDAKARAAGAGGLKTAAVADWRELLGKVDLVSICSPAFTHAEIVRNFLQSGAHVLVEKPIATSVQQADQLIALARARGLVLTVGHQERYVLAKSGLLRFRETPVLIECVREGPWTGRGTDVSVILDLMIHDLDLVHSLIPAAVDAVHADGALVHGQSPDHVTAEIAFANGARAKLTANRAATQRKRSLRLCYGDGGEIALDFLTRAVSNSTSAVLGPLDLSDPLAESVSGFVAAVRAGAPVLVRPEEALRALATAIRIEESLAPVVAVPAKRALRRTA